MKNKIEIGDNLVVAIIVVAIAAIGIFAILNS